MGSQKSMTAKSGIWPRMANTIRQEAESHPEKNAIMPMIATLLVQVPIGAASVFFMEMKMGEETAVLLASLMLCPFLFVMHHENAREIRARNLPWLILPGVVIAVSARPCG